MSESTQSTATTESQEESGIMPRILRVIAVPVALITGFFAARTSVHNSAYNQAKMLGAFDDILSKSTPESRADIQELINHTIDKTEFLKRSMKTKTAYFVAGNARMEEMGLTNFVKKWNYMARADRQVVARSGLAGVGVTLGALLTISDSKALSKLFSTYSKKDSKDSKEEGQQR